MSAGSDYSSIIMRRPTTNEGEIVFKLRTDASTYNEALKIDASGDLVPLLAACSVGLSTNTFANVYANNLTIDTNTFIVDGTNNRVGIGVTPLEFIHASNTSENVSRYQRSAGITDTINLARFSFWDSTAETSYIQASRDGTNNAGKISVYTKDTTGALNETIKFGADRNVTLPNGNIVIGTSGKGIDFSITANSVISGTTTGSELFDDYEEGTWTPTDGAGTPYTLISLAKTLAGSGYAASNNVGATTTLFSGAGSGMTVTWATAVGGDPVNPRVRVAGTGYTDGSIITIDGGSTPARYQIVTAKGTYTKIGDMVTACFEVTYPLTTSTPSASEQILISGLPYVCKSGASAENWGGYFNFTEYNGAEMKTKIDAGSNYFKVTSPGGTLIAYSTISQLKFSGTLIYKTT
jgi:hypothetical protein